MRSQPFHLKSVFASFAASLAAFTLTIRLSWAPLRQMAVNIAAVKMCNFLNQTAKTCFLLQFHIEISPKANKSEKKLNF